MALYFDAGWVLITFGLRGGKKQSEERAALFDVPWSPLLAIICLQ
jgi:tmRNA-binding protein